MQVPRGPQVAIGSRTGSNSRGKVWAYKPVVTLRLLAFIRILCHNNCSVDRVGLIRRSGVMGCSESQKHGQCYKHPILLEAQVKLILLIFFSIQCPALLDGLKFRLAEVKTEKLRYGMDKLT
jgi:hypothetical protein